MAPVPRRPPPTSLVVAIVAALAAASLAAPAAAHPDALVAAGTHPIGAGESLSLPVELHYHRIVGHVRAASGEGALTVRVEGPEGAEVLAGPGPDLRVNALVACCKGTAWAAHTLVVENRGAAPVEAAVDLAVLHDGLAVAIDDAEDGALATLVVLFGGASAALAPRVLRPGPSDISAARRSARRAVALHAAMWVVAAPFALLGMARSGGGPVVGSLAGTALLPPLDHPVLTWHTLLLLGTMALWVLSLAAWSDAARRAPAGHRLVPHAGLALGAGALAASLLWGIEYGALAVPLLAGLLAAALPLGGALWLRRRARDASPLA